MSDSLQQHSNQANQFFSIAVYLSIMLYKVKGNHVTLLPNKMNGVETSWSISDLTTMLFTTMRQSFLMLFNGLIFAVAYYEQKKICCRPLMN